MMRAIAEQAERDRAALLMTVNDVARELRVSARHVWALVAKGALPAPLRAGRAARWRPDGHRGLGCGGHARSADVRRYSADGGEPMSATKNNGFNFVDSGCLALLPSAAVRVWLVLYKHADAGNSRCNPSLKRIGELAGVHPSSISKSVARLVEAGLVKRTPGGGTTRTQYQLLPVAEPKRSELIAAIPGLSLAEPRHGSPPDGLPRAGTAAGEERRQEMTKMRSIIPAERIDRGILLIRGQRIILDADLAEFYGVPVGRLNEAVRRNRRRFPSDFMFQLNRAEWENLKSQSAIASSGWGGRRTPPYAFTEQGVAMLSGVLRSERAITTNVEIMRAFVRLRQVLAIHKDLARKIDDLERQFSHKTREHEEHIRRIFEIIEALMEPAPDPPRRRIGYLSETDGRVSPVAPKGGK